MFNATPAPDPIEAVLTKAGRWFRVFGAVVHMGLNTVKGLARGAKPGKIVSHAEPVDGSAAAAAPAANACREAREADIRQRVMAVIDREAVDADHHDALVAALDARLSFNLAYVDIDILPLRERVMRLCADLRLGPDRRRWQAEDFSSRRHHADNSGGSAPRTKADLAKADRPRAHRPPQPILAVARLE